MIDVESGHCDHCDENCGDDFPPGLGYVLVRHMGRDGSLWRFGGCPDCWPGAAT